MFSLSLCFLVLKGNDEYTSAAAVFESAPLYIGQRLTLLVAQISVKIKTNRDLLGALGTFHRACLFVLLPPAYMRHMH